MFDRLREFLRPAASCDLRINFSEGDLPCLHPQKNMAHVRALSLSKWLFDGLTRIDENGIPQLSGAESYTVSSDELTYAFILRKTKWSDGSWVTAYDYERAWIHGLDPSSSGIQPELLYVIKNAEEIRAGRASIDAIGVHAKNARTLIVHLSYLCPTFLHQIASPLFFPLKDPRREPCVFNGAFIVENWNRQKNLVLKKNQMFWNHSQVGIDTIHISFIRDHTHLQLFDQKKLDWIGEPLSPIPTRAFSYLDPDHRVHRQPSSLVSWIHINMSFPWLRSKSIRQALSLAIDRTVMESRPIGSPLPYFLSFSDPNIPQSIETARELFENGLRELDLTRKMFPALKLRYSDSLKPQKMAPYLQQIWRAAFGIDIELIFSDWNTFRTKLHEGDFQLGICNEMSLSLDPIEILGKFFSPTTNYGRWASSEFQDCFSRAIGSKILEKRNELLKKAEQILIEELPVIPLATQFNTYAKNPDLIGYAFEPLGILDLSYAKKCNDPIVKGFKEADPTSFINHPSSGIRGCLQSEALSTPLSACL